MQRSSSLRRKAGFSLVEITLGIAVMGMVLGALAQIGVTTSGAFKTSASQLDMEIRARQSITRVLQELTGVIADTMEDDDPVNPAGASRFRFRTAVGRDANGDPIPGEFQRLEWQRDPAENDNGVDDDGDGLIDEGRLLLTRDAELGNATPVIICRNVAEFVQGEVPNGVDDNGNDITDEPGFVVRREGALLSIWLTVEEIEPQTGQLIQRTTQTAVRLRNGL